MLDELLSLALSVGGHLEELSLGHDVLVRQLTAGRHHDLLCWLPGLRAESLNFLDDAVAGDDLTEDDMLAVQPVRLGCGDEELGPVVKNWDPL